MSGFIKPALKVVLLLGILAMLLLTACVSPKPESGSIYSPVKIPYLVRNPLEIIDQEQAEGDHFTRTITIEGLSDQKIQESINSELEQVYADMQKTEIPPYRGIRQKINRFSVLSGSSVDANMSFNYNNVISVLIYGNRTYENRQATGIGSRNLDDYGDVVNVGIMEAVNVDLNTGEHITLKEVFADDVDYKGILNDYISKMLEKNNAAEEEEDYSILRGGVFKIVAPFKGISDNQKFFLYQGGVGLIFDYTNPEFDTNLSPVTVYINFRELGDVVAITERFDNEGGSLYESSKPPVYEFLQYWSNNEVREQKNEEIGNASIYQALIYNTDIPKKALEKAKSLYPVDSAKLEEFKKLSKPTEEGWNSFEQTVWTITAGRYTTVSRNTSMYFNNHWKNDNENYCFDEDGNEIEIRDLFVAGYDYEKIIMKGLRNALSQMPLPTEYNEEEIYDGLEFALDVSEISFRTAPLKSDEYAEGPMYFSLTFEEIGCQNLTVFK